MRLIQSAGEVGEAVSRAKTGASAYCSNFFATPKKLQCWITHGEIFRVQTEATVFFLRKDRDHWRIYFCAASPAALQQAVATLPMLGAEPVMVDLVGLETAVGELVPLFETAGFRRSNRLFRMARAGVPVPLPATAPDSRIVLAGRGDVKDILDLLLRSFDGRAEPVPMPYEIDAAVEARQIAVVRCDGVLAGLLFFETEGLTSVLRYWLIAPEYRAQRLGSGLMQRYFAGHPEVRRFLLWVIASNANAISKYKHYGFAPDGLVDHVLANKIIQP